MSKKKGKGGAFGSPKNSLWKIQCAKQAVDLHASHLEIQRAIKGEPNPETLRKLKHAKRVLKLHAFDH